MNNANEIDIVMTWVDGNDPEWIKLFNKYSPNKIETNIDINKSRYKDYGLLKYWFRSVELYAPWVRKIHFITNGQKPNWLNTDNPKLNWVKHEDYIPDQYLPTFSSHPIELNFHLIKDLSEKFIYFNDDIFINNPINPNYFFKNGIPVMHADASCKWIKYPYIFSHINYNVTQLINEEFKFNKVVKNKPSNWFMKNPLRCKIDNLFYFLHSYIPGFATQHQANPYLKQTFVEVWKRYFDSLDNTSMNRFRNINDINQYIFYYWQLCKNNFVPKGKNDRAYFVVSEKNYLSIKKTLFGKKYKVICLNDNDYEDSDLIYQKLIEDFEKKFPTKSSFEV